MEKGNYGYINQYKKKHIIGTAIYAAFIIALVITGRLTSGNVMIISYVVATVLALPAAKHLTAVLIVYPYNTLQDAEKEKLEVAADSLKNGTSIYDVTLSSQEFVAYCPYMFLYDRYLLCIGQITSKISIDSIHNYLEQILNYKGTEFEITVVPGVSEMEKQLHTLAACENDSENRSNIIEDAKKQILIYSV